jgi:hypothetical protein
MGRIRVLAVVGVSAASGLLLTAPALADSTCQGTNEAAVCASGDTSGGTVRVSSDGATGRIRAGERVGDGVGVPCGARRLLRCGRRARRRRRLQSLNPTSTGR